MKPITSTSAMTVAVILQEIVMLLTPGAVTVVTGCCTAADFRR